MDRLMHDTKQHINEIARVVLETLRADFENIKILDVKVSRDEDSDGDEILRIDVVFVGDKKARRHLSGAVRHVRPKLSEIGENAFPLFSFISEGEAGGRVLESA